MGGALARPRDGVMHRAAGSRRFAVRRGGRRGRLGQPGQRRQRNRRHQWLGWRRVLRQGRLRWRRHLRSGPPHRWQQLRRVRADLSAHGQQHRGDLHRRQLHAGLRGRLLPVPRGLHRHVGVVPATGGHHQGGGARRCARLRRPQQRHSYDRALRPRPVESHRHRGGRAADEPRGAPRARGIPVLGHHRRPAAKAPAGWRSDHASLRQHLCPRGGWRLPLLVGLRGQGAMENAARRWRKGSDHPARNDR